MGGEKKVSDFGPWNVRVEGSRGRCAAEVVRGGTRAQCFRSGAYGWRGQGFCYQHHPNYEGWVRELRHIEAIAVAAIAKAEPLSVERGEG